MREILSALIIYYSKIELLLGRGLEKDGGVGRTEAGRPLGLSQDVVRLGSTPPSICSELLRSGGIIEHESHIESSHR
jgi:hypothetical protein